MTGKQLLEKLQAMTEDELNQEVTVYDRITTDDKSLMDISVTRYGEVLEVSLEII